MKPPCPMVWVISWKWMSDKPPMPHGMGYKLEVDE